VLHTHLSHPSLDHLNNTGEEYKLWISSYFNFLHPLATSSILGSPKRGKSHYMVKLSHYTPCRRLGGEEN
jgi:hypothetical protein